MAFSALDSADLANILERVLKNGVVGPTEVRAMVCKVAKVTEDQFDAWMVDRPDLMRSLIHFDLENELNIRANVRRKAEIDPELGLKVLERRDPSNWQSQQKVDLNANVVHVIKVDL